MCLFRSRARAEHKILIALDVSIRDCQKKLNDLEKAFEVAARHDRTEDASIGTKQGTIFTRNKKKIDALNVLKEQLLANVKKIETEIDTVKKNMSDFTV